MSRKRNKRKFKRVPAVDKCFSVLDLFARSGGPLCVSEISRSLNYSKSTVYNLVYTLSDLHILEQASDNKFDFGTRFYALGKCAGNRSSLISTVRPFLEEINRKTRLTVFLGIRSDGRAVILDEVDSPDEIRVSSETGMRIPLLAGAGGKVLLAQLPDNEVDRILSENELDEFTPASCVSRENYRDLIRRARREKFALDDEEYIEGVRAIAVPLNVGREDLQAAIWAVGLKSRIKDEVFPSFVAIVKGVAKKLEIRFSMS